MWLLSGIGVIANISCDYVVDCVECMACSDNVVRAGLTPKFKDVPTLCDILNYHCRPAADNIFPSKPHPDDRFVTLYDPPVAEFTVAKISVRPFYSVPLVSFIADEFVDCLEKSFC